MNAATRADWGAHVDGRIKKVLQDLNIRMARSLGAAVNQALAKEREGIKAELVLRDARIATMEQEFGAAVVQLLAREREAMKAELAARDARIAALEEGLRAVTYRPVAEEHERLSTSSKLMWDERR
jgi:predicted transcriptional regulator